MIPRKPRTKRLAALLDDLLPDYDRSPEASAVPIKRPLAWTTCPGCRLLVEDLAAHDCHGDAR